MGKLFEYTVFPLLLPLILVWLLVARVVSLLVPFLIFPCIILANRLYWAIPFVEDLYRQRGPVRGFFMRIGFEYNYCANVFRRLLTLPLRRKTPDFYIVGFPKCGTTSLASHLREHPAISNLDGLQFHEVLSKESHFFNGILGRHTTASHTLYRSYFPTVLTHWWKECVLGVDKWLCFDACPLPACLPYTAKRIAHLSPDAKLIFMLRDPVSGAFSAEIMLRNLGMPLNWSLMEDIKAADPRFMASPDQERFWQEVEALDVQEPLPEDLMRRFYYNCNSILRCGKYADRIAPFLRHFPRENLMFIDFQEFTTNTQAVVEEVLKFVGADPALYKFRELPPGMQGDRRGRRMHPSVKRKLQQYYRESNLRLYSMLGRDFAWANPDLENPGLERPSALPTDGIDLVADTRAGAGEPSRAAGLRAGSEEEGQETLPQAAKAQAKLEVGLLEAKMAGRPRQESSAGSLDGIKAVGAGGEGVLPVVSVV